MFLCCKNLVLENLVAELKKSEYPAIFVDYHYVKSVRIRSYSDPHFPAFGLNTERYYVSLRI